MIKFLIFFIFISLAYIGLHLYIAKFFIKAGYLKNIANKFFLIIALVSISVLFLRRKLTGDIFEFFYFISFLWMGYVLIFSFFIFLENIFSLFIDFKKSFLIINILTLIVFFISIYNAFKVPKLNEINYFSDKVYNDYKIAFVSDLHLDFSFKRILFSRIIDKILNQDPQILIIGGDFLDPGFKIDKNVNKLRELKIPVLFVLGNHEYYYGIDKTFEVVNKLNFILLKDSSFKYEDLNLIGVSDIRTENLKLEEVREIISKNYDNKKFNILVSHQPLYFKELSKDFDFLMLSGHTHCGQIFPFHIFTRIAYKYFCGEYKENKSFLYVSKGAGSWGPFMRFLSNNEIVILNIKKYEKNNSKHSRY